MSKDQSEFQPVLAALAGDLHQCGVREMFGIAGDPITPLIASAESTGIRYYGFRNEQAAAYAASAVSFLTGRRRIGACMTVAGPGFTNSLTGLANATVNGWPTLLICPFTPAGTGGFQAIDQISCLTGLVKGYTFYTGKASVEQAINLASRDAPYGSVVLFVSPNATTRQFSVIPSLPKTTSPAHTAIPSMSSPQRVLVVIGARSPLHPESHGVIRSIVETGQVPFISESLGRGVIPESHPLCVTAARSRAIASCTVAILVNTQLDWMLHHGAAPKWNSNCVFISTDLTGATTGREHYMSLNDVTALVNSLRCDAGWANELLATAYAIKAKLLKRLSATGSALPSHYEAMGAIKRVIARRGLEGSLIVSEGANTMDAARVVLVGIQSPAKRLDAGRWGTMGSGLGFVMAGHAVNPNELIISIHGDSAFGFSGMELETLVRYKCKCVVIVLNNGGIYTGSRDNATAFSPGIRHDVMMKAFGGTGFSTTGGHSVETVMNDTVDSVQRGKYPVLVDVVIDPHSGSVSGSLSRL